MGAGTVRKGRTYEVHCHLDAQTDPGSCKPTSPKSPTVAELKGRLLELGLDIPANAVEKSELIAAIDRGERNLRDAPRDSPEVPTSPVGANSPTSPSGAGTPKRSVAELKARLKELGFKVPTSIVEKSELLALVQEAERQAAAKGPRPTAPPVASSALRLKTRLRDLGVEVPEGSAPESELQALLLLKEAERRQPVEIEKAVSENVTLRFTKGAHGVANIEVTIFPAPDFGAEQRPAAQQSELPDGAIQGAVFAWVRGDCIGHGAFGTVFKALNQTTGQIMAVKEVICGSSPQGKSDAKFKEALENEISLMQDLRHPNIVAYYGCDSIGNSVYMYLEYMAGGSVSRVLDQFGPFEETLMATYCRQLLSGLEYLHTRSPYVVHRDIKGANVLIGVDCTVKLADFGCSKRVQETMSLTMGGSIPWMAPEVVAHARYGRAGDIWSFGCLMIEMASAAAPWGEFDNLMAAMVKIGMSAEMPPIPETLSQTARAFIRRCLNRDPSRRLSATELLHERFLRSGTDDNEDVLFEATEERSPGGYEEADTQASRPSTANSSLPTGWEKHFDPAYREWYYWHRPTGRSVWERPQSNHAEEDEGGHESGSCADEDRASSGGQP